MLTRHRADLSAAVDVYGEWVDAAGRLRRSPVTRDVATDKRKDAVAKEGDVAGGPASSSRLVSKSGLSQRVDDDEDDRRYEGEGIVGDDEYD